MLKTIVFFFNDLEGSNMVRAISQYIENGRWDLQNTSLGASNDGPSRGARGGVGEGYPLKAGVGGIADKI